MTSALVEAVGEAQRSLATALDAGSAQDVHAATDRLARAVQAIRAAGGWRPTPELKTLLTRALAEGEAARIRTRYLAAHTRLRLDRLQALTGQGSTRYGRTGRYL